MVRIQRVISFFVSANYKCCATEAISLPLSFPFLGFGEGLVRQITKKVTDEWIGGQKWRDDPLVGRARTIVLLRQECAVVATETIAVETIC